VAVLEGVEWGGDFVTGVALIAIALALVALGVRWGRWHAVLVVAVLYSAPLLLLDALYFGLGLNLAGYCGEPKCDPGPVPLSFGLILLPVVLGLPALGVVGRRGRRFPSHR
jgi:hypothetical protein